jgi:hypothetical protein
MSPSKTYVPIYFHAKTNEKYQENYEEIFGKGKSKPRQGKAGRQSRQARKGQGPEGKPDPEG